MFSSLKEHPFAVEAWFEKSLVLSFAVPKDDLQSLIPECLQLECFDNKWAFVAVAMVETKNLRPRGFPEFMGNSFFLIGYRVFVTYTNNAGKRLRGLYILKSETDKKKMEWLGNLFTQYRYSTTDISTLMVENISEISSEKSAFKVVTDQGKDLVALPDGSPFRDWKEARRFAGPLPFTFSYNASKKEVLIIEGVRKDWDPVPVRVLSYDFSFLKKINLKNAVLANAFLVRNIPYYWKKGRKEKWKQ